ncbi:hypothetical protein IJ670_05045 [bacterium]|nr:hypothetical protein [bacterium]
MKLKVNELIKLLIAKDCITQKKLTEILTEKTERKYTPDGFSRKILQGTMTFNEVAEIVDILGYELEVKKKG